MAESPCKSRGFSLFWGSGSTPCWRVMICLEEKGLTQYGSNQLSFLNNEHKSEPVYEINPRGQVCVCREKQSISCWKRYSRRVAYVYFMITRIRFIYWIVKGVSFMLVREKNFSVRKRPIFGSTKNMSPWNKSKYRRPYFDTFWSDLLDTKTKSILTL